MATVTLSGYLASNNPIRGRRMQLTEEDIYALAELARPGYPFHYDHDLRVLVAAHVVSSELRRTDDNYLGLWVEVEIDEEELAKYPDVRAFSVGVGRQVVEAAGESDRPPIKVALDSENWSDEQLAGLVSELRPQFNVAAGWMLRYGELPPPIAMIALALQWVASIPPDVLTSMISDAFVHWLMRPGADRVTEFSFDLIDEDRTIKGHIKTDDPDMFRDALGFLRDVCFREGEQFEWDPETKQFRRIH
jgi:hypothetical protein